MHPIEVLHKLVHKSFPSIHRSRLKVLMAAVESVFVGANVTITSLGRCISNGVYIKHKIKRMDRLVGNKQLYQERMGLYTALTH